MSVPSDDRFRPAGGRHARGPSVNGLDAETIRKRMAQVRSELERDARSVSEEMQRATHWEYYVRKFPYACIGIAAFVGYSLVPSPRRQTVVATDEQIKKLADSGKLHVVADPPPKRERSATAKVGLALGTVVARAVMAYVGKNMGEKANQATR